MIEPSKDFTPNETTKLIDKLNVILYICGMPRFWVADVKLPKKFVRIYDTLFPVTTTIQWLFLALLLGSNVTQKHLNSKQQTDSFVIAVSNIATHFLCIHSFIFRKEYRQVLYYLAVVLKDVNNDKEVEQTMIKKLKLYLVVYALSVMLILGFYGVAALLAAVKTGAPFLATITAWPDVTDTSKVASFARVFFYFLWCVSFYRMSMLFLLVILVLMGLNYQYKQLQKYFGSLNVIFEDNEANHLEKERKFVTALAKGIHAHSDTLWCAGQCQRIYSLLFSCHVILAFSLLVILIPAIMTSKENFDDVCSHMTIVVLTLVIMAFFMWNAGDVTVESGNLPNAIYGSGWYNCYGKSSRRIRNMVVIAMAQAQKPIIFTALGVVELSYETYVAVLKTSYSVVSVFY